MICKQHHTGAAENEEDYRQVVKEIVDDQRRHAVSKWYAFAEQGNFGRFAQQWTSESKKADRFAAETGCEGFQKTNAAVLSGHSGTHRYRTQEMASSADGQHKEEPESDSQQRIEDGLHANAMDNVDKETQAEKKSERLKPDERAP